MEKSRQYYLLALALGLLFHGTIMAFTLENTYDAYVHMFFAEHYSSNWFETWNYKWYTGFTMTSYPPLVHQVIALFSKLIGLKAGFIIWGLIVIALFIRGTYHFSKIWVNETAAGYAAILAVLSSSLTESLHIFGQLPTLTGIALLLNACPAFYKWIRFNRYLYFFIGLSIIACLTTAHHVTTIFGMVFFILPTLGVAVLDLVVEERGGIEKVRVMHFLKKVWQLFPKALLIGFSVIALTIIMIFPYWYWSSTDPITQVSIPHGSRASFIQDPSLGLVFFIIPWGIMLFFLPAILSRILTKRNLFLGLSFCLLFLLGTGGTTPIPKLLLGETAFNILTLDRFTFWATIMALPFFGDVIRSLTEGNLRDYLETKASRLFHKLILLCVFISMLLIVALVINLSNFRPLQPDKIDTKPITSFLERDGHDQWRYMTLGFGDQMAWLAANTHALSLDGNYHSARRLPEMTTRAVERIENSKYLGEEGLESLRQFLSLPEKFNLKYIFSNDKFYEPVLFFYGWTKLQALENNIDVWVRKDVPPLSTLLPKKDIPKLQKLMWGILPLGSLGIAFIMVFLFRTLRNENDLSIEAPLYFSGKLTYSIYGIWCFALLCWTTFQFRQLKKSQEVQKDPTELIHEYFHRIDFKEFDKAYELLEQESRISMEQFMLELSLEDGLLASYAKLDSLSDIKYSDLSKNRKKYKLTAHWQTAVQEYQTEHELILVKQMDQWSIIKESFERDIPQDQFLRIPDIDFLNQGRRQAVAGQTLKEDILDRPDVFIREAHLVKKDSSYHVIGELINIDTDPAFIVVEAVLYNDQKELLRFNANETMIHNLMPKESTYFRVDFSSLLDQFRKDGKTIDLSSISQCVVFVRSTVTDEKLYKYHGLKEIKQYQNKITGAFLNYGNKEISIPQILFAKKENNKIIWVENLYVDRGIRPQREKIFELDLNNEQVNIISSCRNEQLIVNGINMETVKNFLPDEYRSNKLSKDGWSFLTNGLTSNNE